MTESIQTFFADLLDYFNEIFADIQAFFENLFAAEEEVEDGE